MNEYLIEEENTFYEIDPLCKIEPLQKKKRKMSSQSKKNGCSFCEILIFAAILTGMQDPHKKKDRIPSRSRCR